MLIWFLIVYMEERVGVEDEMVESVNFGAWPKEDGC